MMRYWFATWLLFFTTWAQAEVAAVHFEAAEVAIANHGTFDVPPLVVRAADLPDTWQERTLPHVQVRHVEQAIGEAPDDIVTTWFRFHVPSTIASDESVFLYIPRWQTIGQLTIYVNEKLIWHSRGGPIWNAFNHPVWLRLAERDEPLQRNVLIRMDSQRSAGGALSTVWVGAESELNWRYTVRETLQVTLIRISTSAFFLLGLFSFAVWMRRKDSVYALFSAAALFSLLRNLHFHVGTTPLPIPEPWFGWMTVNSLGWLVITIYFFSYRLHGYRFARLERGMLGFMTLMTIATLPGLVPLATLATWVNLLLFGMALIASAAMAITAWRGQSRVGLAISIWNALNIPLGIHDALLQSYAINIESLYLMPYTVLGVFGLFLTILFNRYITAIEAVESANLRLEARLAQRERELEQSHRKVREIEQQKLLAVERQRLMRDMHDGIGASLMMALSVVEARESDPANDVALILRECVDDLKLTIDSLEPVESDLLLLLAAMRFRLEQRFTQSGLTLHWLVEDLPSLKWLDPSSALHVLRILQEVFTNVIKHARAKEIRVATGVSHSGVFVTVEDDGCGFAVEEALARAAERVPGRRGRGLPNLLNRAKLLEGTISWTKGGTRFELWLPLVRNGNT